ncbi:MAG: ATP-grasp domain-containing protein [Hyphomonadaceae bacterium]
MRRLRVLVLAHPAFIPPDSLEGLSEQERYDYKTEFDVMTTLRANGHEVKALGVQEDLSPIRDAVENWRPDIVFNLLEEFQGETLYAQNVAGFLELLRMPYTGCSPRGLMLARGKDISKKLVKYHRMPVPAFAVFPIGERIRKPASLQYPLFVKSVSEDASLGISQASVVESDEKLRERVSFVHQKCATPAIAEQYIEGREIYVGVMGNSNPHVLPVWELDLSKLGAGKRPIATAHVKHNTDYQERRAVLHGRADDLPPAVEKQVRNYAKRIYKALELDGYARVDFRLTPEGVPYFIEANPNPEIASTEEFANAAEFEGMSYGKLLDRLMQLGLERAGSDLA